MISGNGSREYDKPNYYIIIDYFYYFDCMEVAIILGSNG
jgi:hypothetical protein